MMPGDVYELTFRLGFQKWKSKGRIGAGHVSNAQSWHPGEKTFKALLGEVLFIKVLLLLYQPSVYSCQCLQSIGCGNEGSGKASRAGTETL
jgi:hypothetical protein